MKIKRKTVIGIDVNRDINNGEGYTQMSFVKSELIKSGKLQPEAWITVFQTVPSELFSLSCLANYLSLADYLNDYSCEYKLSECGMRVYRDGKRISWPNLGESLTDTHTIYESYCEDFEAIDKMCGRTEKLPFPTTPHEVLCLASDIISYKGFAF